MLNFTKNENNLPYFLNFSLYLHVVKRHTIHRKEWAIRIFSFLMACYIFNFSIDSRDLTPADEPENLSYNEQESLVELILEKGFLMENAVPEQDEQDEENKGLTIIKKIDIAPQDIYKPVVFYNDIKKNQTEYYTVCYTNLTYDIISPPPKS